MDTNGMVPIPDKLRDNFAVIRRQENRRNIKKKPKKLLIYKDGAGKLPLDSVESSQQRTYTTDPPLTDDEAVRDVRDRICNCERRVS